MRVQFGECVLDSDTRQLYVRGEAVHLSPKGFQFLELLLESRPKALSKSEIHERLWPGTFVSDGTLASLLVEVRSATGDSARESRFVRTVHRFGYAFSGSAEELRESVSAVGGRKSIYRLIWGTREIALRPGENLFGRDEDAIVWIDDRSRVAPACTNRDRRGGSDPGRSRQHERDVPAREENRCPHEARRRRPGDDRAGLDDLPHLQADGLDGDRDREIGPSQNRTPRLIRKVRGSW